MIKAVSIVRLAALTLERLCNLRRLIQKQVEDQIAEGIIARRGESSSQIMLSAENGKVEVRIA